MSIARLASEEAQKVFGMLHITPVVQPQPQLTHPLSLPEWVTLEDFELVPQGYKRGNVTVEEAPTSFSPFSLVDCTLLSHFSINDFITVAFPDLAGDLNNQIYISDRIPFFSGQYCFPMLLFIAWSFSTFPLIVNNRYLPSSSSLLFSHRERHLLDSYINPPLYILSP